MVAVENLGRALSLCCGGDRSARLSPSAVSQSGCAALRTTMWSGRTVARRAHHQKRKSKKKKSEKKDSPRLDLSSMFRPTSLIDRVHLDRVELFNFKVGVLAPLLASELPILSYGLILPNICTLARSSRGAQTCSLSEDTSMYPSHLMLVRATGTSPASLARTAAARAP